MSSSLLCHHQSFTCNLLCSLDLWLGYNDQEWFKIWREKKERRTRGYIISSNLINQNLPALRAIQAAVKNMIQTIYM